MNIDDLLSRVADGSVPPGEARRLLAEHEHDLGYARVDLDRERRCGMPEVIFAEGKTVEHVVGVTASLREAGQGILITRVRPEQAEAVVAAHPDAEYLESARAVRIGSTHPGRDPVGRVGVVCAGTSDLPVADEAAATAEWMGARVERMDDVGVAGLHRLTRRLDDLRACRALVVVAGMEGALPSVVGGLVHAPIIAVPTSVGYGANLGGIAALLAMLNSCAAGISVVNIDNGFGAGVAAARINRVGEREPTKQN